MITTVTLNASIDKAYVMQEAIENGTVMRVKEVRNTAGGKGLNVAKIAVICGAEVLATGFAGGFNGRYLESLAAESHVTTHFCHVEGHYLESLAAESHVATRFCHVEGETRSCINILAPKYGSTEYLEPGFSVKEEDLARFLTEFPGVIGKSTVVTMSGSAPAGIPSDIYRRMTELAKEAGAKVILDTSGDYLKEGLQGRPFMIKPNEDEIEALLGIRAEDPEAVFRAASELRVKYGIPWVVISLGGNGAVLSCDEGVFHGLPPKLDPVNTVGCGDSMVGAFAVALERALSPREALRYAVAVSAAAAMSPLTGDYDPAVFEEIYPQTIVEVKCPA